MDCFNSYYNVKMLLWSIYFTHIIGTGLYFLSTCVTCCKFAWMGWITRLSSIISAILLIYTNGTLTDDICTASNKLFGSNYPGCYYQYPDGFTGTFGEFESDVYVSISTILLIYGMKTLLKTVQVWIPYDFTVNGYCCFK